MGKTIKADGLGNQPGSQANDAPRAEPGFQPWPTKPLSWPLGLAACEGNLFLYKIHRSWDPNRIS